MAEAWRSDRPRPAGHNLEFGAVLKVQDLFSTVRVCGSGCGSCCFFTEHFKGSAEGAVLLVRGLYNSQ